MGRENRRIKESKRGKRIMICPDCGFHMDESMDKHHQTFRCSQCGFEVFRESGVALERYWQKEKERVLWINENCEVIKFCCEGLEGDFDCYYDIVKNCAFRQLYVIKQKCARRERKMAMSSAYLTNCPYCGAYIKRRTKVEEQITLMGRKIQIDIDDLFEILSTLEDGDHSIPMMVFDMIGDCNLNDIAKYAQTIMAQKGFIKSDYDNYKCALEGIFKAWLGKKAIAEMKERKKGGIPPLVQEAYMQAKEKYLENDDGSDMRGWRRMR